MPRGKITKWKPRASQLGAYMQCSYRAAFDRALEEGVLDLPEGTAAAVAEAKASSPYADLGTCIHYHLQAGLGCEWPNKRPATDFAPTPEQLVNASQLFKGDVATTGAAIREAAVRAAAGMPASPDGKPWLAEVGVSLPNYSGHLDFLSQDGSVLVDLKTTSRPPETSAVKPSHLVQVLAYAHAVNHLRRAITVRRIYVLYVDSLRASWHLLMDIDPLAPGIVEYSQKVQEYIAFLRSSRLYATAWPAVGHACSEWCPYTSICRDQYRAGTGSLQNKPAAPAMTKGPLG